MKIAIAGPGRSGTSVLVKILGGWGFSVPSEDHHWHKDANAGLESRLGSNSPFDVDKDPWAYQYLDKLSDEQILKYSVLIVPIRDLELAAKSRSVIDRASRHDDGKNQYWSWDDWGAVPGGAIYSTTAPEQERLLASGLWRLLTVASTRGLKIVILNFPKFVLDFEYTWKEISPHLNGRISKSRAKAVFDSIVDTSTVNTSVKQTGMTLPEAIDLLKIKSKSISSLSKDLENSSKQALEFQGLYTQKNLELEAKNLELEAKNLELEALRKTFSWKLTAPLRVFRAFLGRI